MHSVIVAGPDKETATLDYLIGEDECAVGACFEPVVCTVFVYFFLNSPGGPSLIVFEPAMASGVPLSVYKELDKLWHISYTSISKYILALVSQRLDPPFGKSQVHSKLGGGHLV